MTDEVSRADPGNELRRIGVLGRSAHEDLPSCVQRLARFADDHDLSVCFEEHLLADAPEGAKRLDLDDESVDFFIAFGGDGTLLRAGRMAAGREIPVLGINVGHLGFLTGLPHLEMEDRLGRVLEGDYVLDRAVHGGSAGDPHRRVGGRSPAGMERLRDPQGWGCPGHPPGLCAVKEGEDWQEVGSFSGDGLIVSTPHRIHGLLPVSRWSHRGAVGGLPHRHPGLSTHPGGASPGYSRKPGPGGEPSRGHRRLGSDGRRAAGPTTSAWAPRSASLAPTLRSPWSASRTRTSSGPCRASSTGPPGRRADGRCQHRRNRTFHSEAAPGSATPTPIEGAHGAMVDFPPC